MIWQKEITLSPYSRGFHLITHELLSQIDGFPDTGIMNLFIKHTSAALTINENADPSVRTDLDRSYDELVREREPYYTHTYEGDDDMPAHIKSSITGCSINIPITNGKPNLGTWQGIYLCEFRNNGGKRRIVITIHS